MGTNKRDIPRRYRGSWRNAAAGADPGYLIGRGWQPMHKNKIGSGCVRKFLYLDQPLRGRGFYPKINPCQNLNKNIGTIGYAD